MKSSIKPHEERRIIQGLRVDKFRVIQSYKYPEHNHGVSPDFLTSDFYKVSSVFLRCPKTGHSPPRYKQVPLPTMAGATLTFTDYKKAGITCLGMNVSLRSKFLARFEVGKLKSKSEESYYTGWEFNPNRVSSPEERAVFREFDAYIRQEVGEDAGYRHIYDHGRTKKLHTPIDIPLPMEQLLFYRPGSKKAGYYWEEEDPHAPPSPGINLFTNKLEWYPIDTKGAYYIGDRKSENSIACYDKVSECKETGKAINTTGPLTRVEGRDYAKDTPPTDLQSAPHPLADTWIISVAKAQEIDPCPRWQKFLRVGVELGVNTALEYAAHSQRDTTKPDTLRRAYISQLNRCRILDNQKELQASYKRALEFIKPEWYFGVPQTQIPVPVPKEKVSEAQILTSIAMFQKMAAMAD
jgi:hypothetical protein